MKKNISNTIKLDKLVKQFNEFREVVLQIHAKVNPNTTETEILMHQLKAKEWEIMQHMMLSELKQTKKEIEICLGIIKLIKKPRILRSDLIKLDAVFDDFNCIAIIGGVTFRSYYMLVNQFYVMQG